jgi:hypothetical protein
MKEYEGISMLFLRAFPLMVGIYKCCVGVYIRIIDEISWSLSLELTCNVDGKVLYAFTQIS